MKVNVRSLRGVAAVLGVAVLALAACSSSKSAQSSTRGSGAAPIVVGTVCSCSGAGAGALGYDETVGKAWETTVNASGGINGHPVKLIQEDDGSDPAKALQLVKKLVEQDHIVALVGETSIVDESFASYLASKGVPAVGGITQESPFWKNPDFYPSGTQLPGFLFGTVQLAKDAGKQKVGTLYCAEVPVCRLLANIMSQSATVLGGITTTSAKYSSTATDYTALCLAMKSAGVDALFGSMLTPQLQKLTSDCSTQGYKPLQVNTLTASSRQLAADSSLNGMELASPTANYVDSSIPAVKQFLDAVDAVDPSVTKAMNFPYHAIDMWAGGMLFEAAAKAASLTPTSSSADVKRGLYSLKNETLGGLAPPLNFTSGQPSFVGCWFVVKIANGTFESENGGKPTCVDPSQEAGLRKIVNG